MLAPATTYADHVEEQRAAILDLVHDLLRDAVIIQGIGIVLGVVTAGTTAAGAAALNAAKIAAAAPRLLRIIATLRSLASTCAAPVRLAAGALRDVRARAGGFPTRPRHGRLDVRRRAAGAGGPLAEVVHNSRLLQPAGTARPEPQADREMLRRLGGPASPRRARESSTSTRSTTDRQIRVMEGYPPGNRPDPLTRVPTL